MKYLTIYITFNLTDNLKDLIYKLTPDCVIVDECQFLTIEQVEQLKNITETVKMSFLNKCVGSIASASGVLLSHNVKIIPAITAHPYKPIIVVEAQGYVTPPQTVPRIIGTTVAANNIPPM